MSYSFATPWTMACHAPLSMEFSRQEYWSGFPFSPLGDLPDPGIKLVSLVSPALTGRFFTTVPLVYCSTIYNSQAMEATYMCINRRMNEDVEMWCIHTHTHTRTMEYYSAIKKWNNVTCSNMDGSIDCHSERSKSDSEGEMYDNLYMWNLKRN